MTITREGWLHVLTAAGVRASIAVKWLDALFEQVQPDRFNEGVRELDDFLAQALYETGNLEHLEESLNYRPETLQRVWPERFPCAARAIQYAFQPEKLANEVYGGRMGNNAWGDGWKFRGRGIPMITGHDNYAALAKLMGLPLLDDPDLLLKPDNAMRCGVLWWERHIPDDAIDSIERTTRYVQGGSQGLEDRRQKYTQVHQALKDIEK